MASGDRSVGWAAVGGVTALAAVALIGLPTSQVRHAAAVHIEHQGVPLAASQAPTFELQTSGTSYTLIDVDFVDAENGWAVGGEGENNEKYALLKTTDGGRRWYGHTTGLARQLEGVSFVSTDVGWVVGYEGIILHTTDGGANWTRQPSGVTNRLTSVFFLDERLGWVTAARSETLLKTTDGGATWSALEIKENDDLTDVFFVDERRGWAIGNKGVLLGSDDGGATWTTLDYGSSGQMYGVYFVDALRGWIGGHDIRASSDGGVSWVLQADPPKSINDIAFANADEGWAVGDEGVIMHTADGGATWEREAEGLTKRALRGVALAGSANLWAVGTGGTIVYRKGPYVEPTPTPSTTPSPTSTPTRTPTPTATHTPTPTATPSGPWLDAGPVTEPLLLAPMGDTVLRVAFGNMPVTSLITGTLAGAAVFGDGTRAQSASVTTSDGAGAFPFTLRAAADASSGQFFVLTVEMESARAVREGVIAYQALMPVAEAR